jgi:chromosome segregation ATPase
MSNVTIDYSDKYKEADEKFRLADAAACGPICQERRRIQELKTKKEEAKFNLDTAEQKFQDAKRDFIIEKDGLNAYNEMKEDEAINKANETTSKYESHFDELIDEISHSLASLNSQKKSMNQLKSVRDNYNQETSDMREVATQIKSLRDTNMRTSTFNSQSVQYAQLLRGYLSNLYWFLVIIYIVVVLVIGQQFRYLRGWGFLTLLLIYPYLIKFLVPYIPTRWFISLDVKSPE